ncbi:MAG: Holliday junction resolvase RuvX [Byssovorax sp.]
MVSSTRSSAARVAAIDLGKARVGVAVSDELGLLAHPRPHLDGKSRKVLLDALRDLAREDKITRFLVGYPLEMSGHEGAAARRAMEFAQQLADATGIEVELCDERLTTTEASRRLREGGTSAREGKGRVDGAAAAVMLQAWLDRNRSTSND